MSDPRPLESAPAQDPMELSPELRRRNRRLGQLLGGLCLASTVVYIIIFTRHGLPKDPDEWRRQQAHRQAESADPHAESTAP